MTVLKGIFGPSGQVVSFMAAKDQQIEQRIQKQLATYLKEIRGLMAKKSKVNTSKTRVSILTFPKLIL